MAQNKFALFGVGRMGNIYLPTLLSHPDIILGYVVDANPDVLIDLKSRVPDSVDLVELQDAEKVFSDPKIRGIVITTPSFTHEALVRRALLSGKHVYCEKPLSPNDDDVVTLYNLAVEKQVELFCAFNRRFDVNYKNAFDMIRSDDIGKVHVIKLTHRDGVLQSTDYLKHSGGYFKDSSVHDIDMMCWLMQEKPIEVFSFGSSIRPGFAEINDFDTLVISMKFKSGALGVIDMSRHASYGYDQRAEIFGTKGVEGYEQNGRIHTDTTIRYNRAYIAEMNHFVALIEGSDKPRILAKEVIATNKIASAAQESAATGQVVKLAWENS